MASFLEDLIREDTKFLVSKIYDDSKSIREQIDGFLSNFNQLINNGDKSYLIQEYRQAKENSIEKQSGGLKKRQKPKSVLTDITESNVLSIKIKNEKLSTVLPPGPLLAVPTRERVDITSSCNDDEEMPAPKQLPPRKKKIKTEPVDLPKRPTRSRKKPSRYDQYEETTGNISDVIIQNTTITTIDLNESSDKETDNKIISKTSSQELSTRTKRTRVVKKQNLESVETRNSKELAKTTEDVNKPGETKVVSPSNNTFSTVDKHVSTLNAEEVNKNPNATFVASTQKTMLNLTVVLEKRKESTGDVTNDANNTPKKQKKNNKEIFSPYDKTTTKSKVEAFEKLNAKTLRSPSVATKNNLKVTEDGTDRRLKSKLLTPIGSRLAPKTNSTSKIHRIIDRQDSISSQSSLLSAKSQSALKASQAEYRERMKNREDALKKRDAQLQKATEERRKKREEKQLKAQQQREFLEKEKLKKLKEEEDRNKQVMEEKLHKQKEEAERKLLVKKQEDRKRKLLEAEKLSKHEIRLPAYMISAAPLLPTDDCFDSDEEEHDNKNVRIPEWSQDRNLKRMQIVMIKIGEKMKNTFFCRQAESPNLLEIFENIDPRKLKRTSSAIWRKPPRYTVFQESSTIYFSEDDE